MTQPTAGEFKAFAPVCTHQRCLVGNVQGGDDQLPAPRQHVQRCRPARCVGRPGPGAAAGQMTVTVAAATPLTVTGIQPAHGPGAGRSASDRAPRLVTWPIPRRTDPRRGRSRSSRASTGSATRTAGSIYVGKAKSLRSRLSSYFQDISALHPRTQQMVTTAASVEWTVVATEVEALQLEYAWIKEFDPRFNVKYRDDKSYPYLAVTLGEEFPRVQVMRGAKRKGARYFGPYAHAWAIRETRRPAAAGVPGPHLQRRRVQAGRARSAGRACSATSASARRRASAGSARRSTARSPRTSATSWPATPTGSSAGSSAR